MSYSGGNHSNRHRDSKTKFPGAKRYSYVKNGATYYFYSTRDWTNPKEIRKTTIIMIILIIPFLLFAIYTTKNAFNSPQKLKAFNEIVVQDNLGIADRSVIDPALKEYQDATGITPAIVTGENKDWNSYSNMKNYVYDLYTDMFNRDGTYLLIVYTTDSDNCHCELRAGDNTSDILNTKEIEKLNSNLSNNFKNTSTSFSEGISTALKNSAKSSMRPRVIPINLFGCFLLYGFIALFVFIAFRTTRPEIKGYKGGKIELAPEGPEEPAKPFNAQMFKNIKSSNNKPTFNNESVSQSTLLFNRTTCRYCGKTFDIDNKYRCPNCGAQLETWQIEDANNRFK